MIYKRIIKYANLLLSTNYNRLLIAILAKYSKIIVKQTIVCKNTLNNFTQQKSPNHSIVNIKFLVF